MERINGIPTRTLGSTGVRVTAIGLGGYHIGRHADAQVGVRIIRAAIDQGINFLDNAWCYNQGESERVMGRALQGGYRDKVFLMTKNHGRNAATFRQQLEESLRRLQSEHIDLLQFHEINQEGLTEQILGAGAIEEAFKAKDAGKIRFVGFTGHRWPHLLCRMLDAGPAWDTVQFPVNLLDAHFRSFAAEVLPILKERGVGAIGMKSLVGGRLLETGVSVREGIAYALSLPIDTLVSGIDSLEVLEQNLRIARAWQPMSEEERHCLLEQVSPWAGDGHLEYYKTE